MGITLSIDEKSLGSVTADGLHKDLNSIITGQLESPEEYIWCADGMRYEYIEQINDLILDVNEDEQLVHTVASVQLNDGLQITEADLVFGTYSPSLKFTSLEPVLQHLNTLLLNREVIDIENTLCRAYVDRQGFDNLLKHQSISISVVDTIRERYLLYVAATLLNAVVLNECGIEMTNINLHGRMSGCVCVSYTTGITIGATFNS